MTFLGFTISRSRPAPVKRSVSPEIAAFLRGDDLTPAGPILGNAYEQVVWVYRAINVLAEQIANVPFLFSRGERGREHLITSGPLHDFYNRPHPHLNRFQYWELRILWLMLRGECFRLPVFGSASSQSSASSFDSQLAANRSSDPFDSQLSTLNPQLLLRSVLILDPAHFQHIIENHQLIGWRYTGLGKNAPIDAQVFLPEEVWFERLPNPFDFWRGLSPLRVADLPARTDFAAASFMRGILDNNGELGTIVRTSEQLTEDQREQVLSALRSRKRRAGIPDRPLLLSDATEVIQPRISSADLQFLENRKFSRSEICAAFGIPEEIVSTTDHNKYDVMQGARLNFIENRVAPLCARLEAEEQRTIRAIDPTAVGWFDLESLPIMQTARRARLATAKTGFDMGVPFNELNRVLDLGFTPLPWGNTGFAPNTLQPLGQFEPPAAKSTSPAEPKPATPTRDLPTLLQALLEKTTPKNGTPPATTKP